MLKNLGAALLCLALTALTPLAPAQAGCTDSKDRTIRIVNRSGFTAYSVRATNTGNSSWGPDIAQFTIPPGDSLVVDMDDGSCRCRMDLRAEATDGKTYWEKYGVNVCSSDTWILRN